MGIKVKAVSWGVVSLWSLASLAAAGSDSRLVEAVKNKDGEAVRSLLQQHVDVNARHADGSTALAWAAHWNDLEMADLLISAGADVNAQNEYGVPPLWLACNNGSAAMVEKLVKAGANPNATLLETGETALMTCARSIGNPDAVKSLLAHGADVNVKEKQKGQTALMWALERRHQDVARVLIEHGADIHAKSKGGFTPLLFAARQGDLDSARLLLERGADVNDKAPVQRVYGKAREQERGSVGNEVVPGGLGSLLVAADSGHEALALFLVGKGADVNAADPDGFTALHYTIRKGYTILTMGQRRNASSAVYRFRPNMSELVKVLLEHGANPNARIERGPEAVGSRGQFALAGATPFMLAAAAGDVGLMKTLLAKGADPKMGTFDHTTPLMAAAGVGRKATRTKDEEAQTLEAVKLMLELGADVNEANDEGRTALHSAAFSWADEIIQFLVAKGARLDLEDMSGQTPLSIAEGDPNDFVDASEKSARGSPASSTAKLIRKLGGDPLAQGLYLTSEKASQ
ncbi:MAG: hypothetical protein A3J28_05865 [Acidobacteria bacterium RIFCSPLOWO2_12_FULL_60_22]|nr:MAG: hypothetical protein A3J28_05865 [Acidobacteria bacterium RIFCSPLOWO2_12_FULL_60_22]